MHPEFALDVTSSFDLPESPALRPHRMSLGNVAIDTYSERALLREIVDHAANGSGTRQIATVNAQFYVLAEKSERFRRCLQSTEYLCADGMSIVWACRAFAGQQVERVAGVDLITNLCREGAPLSLRVFLLGGKPGTAEATARMLEAEHPGIQIAGVLCPEHGFESSPAVLQSVLETVAEARPDILFVALGAPRQELFIERHIRPLGVPVAVGIGGSFEILSGQVERAPVWMQQNGLEWMHRLLQEPGRLAGRYLIGNLQFAWCLAKWRYRVLGSALSLRTA